MNYALFNAPKMRQNWVQEQKLAQNPHTKKSRAADRLWRVHARRRIMCPSRPSWPSQPISPDGQSHFFDVRNFSEGQKCNMCWTFKNFADVLFLNGWLEPVRRTVSKILFCKCRKHILELDEDCASRLEPARRTVSKIWLCSCRKHILE